MDVIFQTKSTEQNRYSIGNVPGYDRVYFKKGSFKTSDKKLIEILINHPLMRRGDYYLVTNPELVQSYLTGDEPEVLTKEILDGITKQGLLELKEVLGATEEQPVLIKIQLQGMPITSQVRDILNYYRIASEAPEELTEAKKTRKTAKLIKEEEV